MEKAKKKDQQWDKKSRQAGIMWPWDIRELGSQPNGKPGARQGSRTSAKTCTGTCAAAASPLKDGYLIFYCPKLLALDRNRKPRRQNPFWDDRPTPRLFTGQCQGSATWMGWEDMARVLGMSLIMYSHSSITRARPISEVSAGSATHSLTRSCAVSLLSTAPTYPSEPTLSSSPLS